MSKGLPAHIIVAALIAVAILATSFSGFKPTAFATAVASCTNINAAGSYQLSGNLFSTSTCINITSSNTELDCNNFWINDSSNGAQHSAGINITNADNVTVHNCRINGYGGASGFNDQGGIIGLNVTNLSIGNNILLNSSEGAAMRFSFMNNSIIANNSILNTKEINSAQGIYFVTSSFFNNTIRNNTIRNIYQVGILIESSSSAQVLNNVIENNTIEYLPYQPGISLSSGDTRSFTNTTISSNTIRHIATSAISINAGIRNLTIQYNTIMNTSSAISLFALNSGNFSVHSNLMYNNTGYAIRSRGVFVNIYNNTLFNNTDGIRVSGDNESVYNNTITNHTDLDGAGGYAIFKATGSVGSAYPNITGNTIESNNYGIYAEFGDRNINISANTMKYNRNYALQLVDAGGGNQANATITRNTICYNNASIVNDTRFYTVANNTFCADRVAPAENTLYSDVTSFTVNASNTFNVTRGQTTSCSLFVNGVNVSTNNNIGQKLNTTFTYTPTASGNWYVYCADTFANPNTANSSLFLLSAAAAPPGSGGGDTGGEVKLPPTPKVKDFTLSAIDSILQIFLGKSASNSLLIENTGEEDLVFSTLTVTGVDSSWLSLPSSLPTVLAGSSATLDIGITVPSDASPKLYTAHASATASGITKSTSFDVRVEAACDGCFQVKLKDPILNASRGNPVYTQLTITNVGNVELTAALSATGETRSWMLFSQDSMAIPAGQEQSQTIEITPTVSEKGIYPINITVSSGTKTEQVVLLINLQPGCPVCPASQSSGACVNGKQQLTSYVCSEQTNLQCQPVAQEVSCALVKKKKLLLPFWEAPLEHVEANWWWIILILIAYAGYRYYKKRQATNKDQS